MKFITEINPNKLLDTELNWKADGHCTTNVFQKPNKYPNVWESKIPKRYKRNTIKTDLHRAQKISSDFDQEIKIIKNRYLKANYPLVFINNVINNFKLP